MDDHASRDTGGTILLRPTTGARRSDATTSRRPDASDDGRQDRTAGHAGPQETDRAMRRLAIAETLVCAALILWIQVVGVVTGRVAPHVVHALPLVPFLFLTKTRWVRLTSLSACLLWVFALTVLSPLVRRSIIEGGLWRDGGMYPWLAPGVAVLCGVCVAINLTILARSARKLPLFLCGTLLLIPIFAMLRPVVHQVCTVPVARVLTGQQPWVIVLVAELLIALAAFWFLTVRLTRRTDLQLSLPVLLRQGIYWAFFVMCTASGVPYAVFPPS